MADVIIHSDQLIPYRSTKIIAAYSDASRGIEKHVSSFFELRGLGHCRRLRITGLSAVIVEVMVFDSVFWVGRYYSPHELSWLIKRY